MALDHPVQPHHLLQRVNVLGVVAEEFVVLLQRADEVVGGRGAELAGVDLAGKLEERSRGRKKNV